MIDPFDTAPIHTPADYRTLTGIGTYEYGNWKAFLPDFRVRGDRRFSNRDVMVGGLVAQFVDLGIRVREAFAMAEAMIHWGLPDVVYAYIDQDGTARACPINPPYQPCVVVNLAYHARRMFKTL